MKTTKFYIGKIPVIIWGAKSDKIYIYVHGKKSNKESAESFAIMAEARDIRQSVLIYQNMANEKTKITGVIFLMVFLILNK